MSDTTQQADELLALALQLAEEDGSTRESANVEAQELVLALSEDAFPIRPSDGLRGRLLASTREGRLARFAEQLGALVDVSMERASALLERVDDAASWQASLLGLDLLHFDGGPSIGAASAGFVRLPPGATFPTHKHLGEEIVFVVQGSYRDEDASIARPGDVRRAAAGTAHSFTVLPGPTLVYLSVVHEGLDIEGFGVIRVGDPLL